MLTYIRMYVYVCMHVCRHIYVYPYKAPEKMLLWTIELLAMAPKVWMHKPAIPGLLVVRIVEKHPLSTGASREAPVDKCAPRHGAKGMDA